MSAFRLLASWLLALALIAFFLHVTLHPWPNPVAGYIKFYDAPGENLLFSALAERSGISLFEPAGRFVSGIIELIAALLLLLPLLLDEPVLVLVRRIQPSGCICLEHNRARDRRGRHNPGTMFIKHPGVL